MVALLLVAGCAGIPAGDGKGRAVSLFNGRDLDGFYTWLVDTGYADPRQVFTVTNRMLRISGDGLGYLATRSSFSNYTLRVEFRWGATNSAWGNRIGRARDSGLFLHGIGPDGNSHDGAGAFKSAIECNIFEGAAGDLLLIRGTNATGGLIAPRVTSTMRARDADGWPYWDPNGTVSRLERWGRLNWRGKDPRWRDEFGFRGRHDAERPAGHWNRIDCVCREDAITIYVNAKKVNHATHVYPSAGQILLQCEGSEIFVRRLELWPLSSKM